jgi:vacuolar-type H+-ATPase subunit H
MMAMSTDYTQTLKSIKEAEETSAREIAEKKKSVAEKLQNLEVEANKSIAAAKEEAEAYVAEQVENARSLAQVEADKLIASTKKDAQKVASKKLEKTAFKKIIEDTLLSEFKGA